MKHRWLRSEVCERGGGAKDAEQRLAKRRPSATPAAELQTEACRTCVRLDDSAPDERPGLWSGAVRGRKGNAADRQAVEQSKPRVGHGDLVAVLLKSFPFRKLV